MTPTTTLPANADEFEDWLSDDSKLATLFDHGKPKAEFSEFVRGYAKQQAVKDAGIADQIRDQSQRGFADALREGAIEGINRLNLAPDGAAAKNRASYSKRAVGAALDKDYGEWPAFLQAIWSGNLTQEGHTARADIRRIMNSFGSSVPSDGGFLIPETLRAELLRVALETAMVRPRARVVPMESLTVPYPMIDDVSHASSVFGGVTGYWTEESGALTQSSPKFGRVNLVAKKLTIYSEIPNELFADSILSLQQFMDQSFPEALSFFEDVAFISGSGVGEPLGFLNAPAAVSIAAESGQATATIVYQNLVKMYARMLPSSLQRSVWVAHIDTFSELATMALSVGTGGGPVWLASPSGGPSAADTPPMTILGRPVYFTEKVSPTGTAGDINLVDFGYYLIGDRQLMQSETSTHYQFGNDKTAVRVIERVDGRPWINSAITPRQGSNTLSPFVKIATRP